MKVRYTEIKEVQVKFIRLSEDGDSFLLYNYDSATPFKTLPVSDFVDCVEEVKT